MMTLDAETHVYSDGTDRKWISVSRVIDSVLKKSFDGVDPAVLANAAERGRKTEDYCTAILKDGYVIIPEGEREDVRDRVKAFYDWFSTVKPALIASQKIVHGEVDGVAGCLDYLWVGHQGRTLADLKCTAQPEKSWALQLGAYVTYCDVETDECGILHLNPKFKNGWIWRAYDPMIVKSQWASALNWFKTLQSLKVEV